MNPVSGRRKSTGWKAHDVVRRRPHNIAVLSLLAILITIAVSWWTPGDQPDQAAGQSSSNSSPLSSSDAAGATRLNGLTWPVPPLDQPTVIWITDSNRDLSLPMDRDFLLKMPDFPLTGPGGLRIDGGRNVVVIGGEISIADVPQGTAGADRRGLVVKNQTGVVHIEGLEIRGEDLAEGIQIAAPDAIVQLQKIRIGRVSSDDASFHSDVLQVWGGVQELRVDRLTGQSAFQGIFLKSDISGANIGAVDLRRVNIIGGSGYNFYADETVGSITTSEVYALPGPTKQWRYSAFPPVASGVWSGVVHGAPRSGDFVPRGTVGLVHSH